MVQVPVQSAARVTLQVPSLAQQLPVGCEQRLGSQSPNIVHEPSHSA